jgi:hypothetical protein
MVEQNLSFIYKWPSRSYDYGILMVIQQEYACGRYIDQLLNEPFKSFVWRDRLAN